MYVCYVPCISGICVQHRHQQAESVISVGLTSIPMFDNNFTVSWYSTGNGHCGVVGLFPGNRKCQ